MRVNIIHPLVSIVIPSYNQAQFLEYTLQSVLTQDYPEIELVVVDGSSRDGSREIIERYASHLAWWVSEPDNGQAEAINKGLRQAKGEIVAWLNSDDLYLPGAIQLASAALQAEPQLGLVFSNALTIDAGGRLLNQLVFGDWGLAEFLRFHIICQPAVFMRRAVVEKAGFLDTSYHYMLDHCLWLRMARLAPIRHLAGFWAAARSHQAAKNVAQATAFGAEIFRILDWAQAQPDLSQLIQADRRHVYGGAYRLQARYLLDGENYGNAIMAYARAAWYWPSYTAKHSHRIAYALARLIGIGKLADQLALQANQRRKISLDTSQWQSWPGLNLQS